MGGKTVKNSSQVKKFNSFKTNGEKKLKTNQQNIN